MIVALAFAAVMAQAQPPVRDAPPVAVIGTATVSGVVVSADAQPRPLRRARVTLNGQALPRTAITADDGSFFFDRVPAGRVTLSAVKDGYVPMSYGATRTGRPGSGVQVAEGQVVRVSLSLPRGAVITGTLVDVDGLPAQGLAVTALARRYVGSQGERAIRRPCRRSRCRTIAAPIESSVFRPATTSSPRSRRRGRPGSRAARCVRSRAAS
jgi:hypothetical protein